MVVDGLVRWDSFSTFMGHAIVEAGTGDGGGQVARQSLLRFCEVAASRNSSLAPVSPRSLRRVKPRLRLRSPKPVSIILRWRAETR